MQAVTDFVQNAMGGSSTTVSTTGNTSMGPDMNMTSNVSSNMGTSVSVTDSTQSSMNNMMQPSTSQSSVSQTMTSTMTGSSSEPQISVQTSVSTPNSGSVTMSADNTSSVPPGSFTVTSSSVPPVVQTFMNVEKINENTSLFCLFAIIALLVLFLYKTKLVKF